LLSSLRGKPTLARLSAGTYDRLPERPTGRAQQHS